MTPEEEVLAQQQQPQQAPSEEQAPSYSPETNLQPYEAFDAGFELPVVFAGFDPSQSKSKTVVYKTRFNEDGTNATVDYPADMSIQDIQNDIKSNFKKDAADVQVLLMLNNLPNIDGSAKTRDQKYIPTKEEYMMLKPFEGLFKEPSPSVFDLGYEAAKEIVSAGIEVAKFAGKSFLSEVTADTRKQFELAFEGAEAGASSFQKTLNFGKLLSNFAKKAYANVTGDKEYSDEVEYQDFVNGLEFSFKKQAQFGLQESSVAQLLGIDPNSEQGLQIAEALKQSSPEQRKRIEALSGAVDLATFMAGGELVGLATGSVGKAIGLIPGASKVSQAIGNNAVTKYLSPSYLANDVAPKVAFASAKFAGSAIEKTMKFAFNSINGAIESIEAGSVTPAARMMAKGAAYGAGIYNAAGPIIFGGLSGKALSLLGEVGGVVTEAVSEGGSVRAGLAGLADNSAKSEFVRASARGLLRVAPPDYLFNAMKITADAAVNGGIFVGGLGAMQSYTSGDDPINGFRDGFASGYGMTLPLGAAASVFAKPQFDKAKTAKYFQTDMAGRPQTVKMKANQENGFNVDIEFNDLEARTDLFRRKDLSDEQKSAIIAAAKANETAGGISIFHNGSPEIKKQLQDAGISQGSAFQTINGPEGKPVLVFDVSQINQSTAVHELYHAKFSDDMGKMTADALIKDMEKSGGVSAFQAEVQSFFEKYITRIRESAPTDAATQQHADLLQDRLDAAFNPDTPKDIQQALVVDIMNEYAAHYAGVMLAGLKPEQLMDGRLRNVWDTVIDKVKSNVLSVLDVSKQGLRYDPVYGHFFNEKGQRTIMPEMEKVLSMFTDSIKEGRKFSVPESTNDGATYFDIKTDKPFVSPEDFVEGSPTNKTEKKKILSEWFKTNRSTLAQTNPDSTVLISTEVKYRGDVHGNITKMKDGTPIIFTKSLTDATLEKFAQQEINGVRPYSLEQIAAIKELSNASARGQVIYVDAWHDVGRHTGDRSNVYYGRANRPVLVLGFQQMPTGGPEAIMLDIGRSWHRVKRFAKEVPAVGKAFREAGVETLGDYTKLIQRYFDNYSMPDPVPAAELPGFNESIRDAIAQSLNIGVRDAFRSLDEGNIKNLHTFEGKMIPEQADTFVEVNGKQVKMKRDSQALMSIRLDRVLGASEFRVDGAPVAIKYTSDVPNRVRANFAAKSTRVEKLGDTEIKTDVESGLRMFIEPDGSTKLFFSATQPAKKFSSDLDAEIFANRLKLEAIKRETERLNNPSAAPQQTSASEARQIIAANRGNKISYLADQTAEGKRRAEAVYKATKARPQVNVARGMAEQLAGFLERNTGIALQNRSAVPVMEIADISIPDVFAAKAIEAYPEAASLIELASLNKQIINSASKRIDVSSLVQERNRVAQQAINDSAKITTDESLNKLASDVFSQIQKISYRGALDRQSTDINKLYIKAYEGLNGIKHKSRPVFNLAAKKYNRIGDAGFEDDPVISYIIGSVGKIMSVKTIKQRYKNDPEALKRKLEGYDKVIEQGGLKLASPTHNKIFNSKGGGLDIDDVHNHLQREFGENRFPTWDSIWDYIEEASHSTVRAAKQQRAQEANQRIAFEIHDNLISSEERSGFSELGLTNNQGAVVYTSPLKKKQYAIVVGKTVSKGQTKNKEAIQAIDFANSETDPFAFQATEVSFFDAEDYKTSQKPQQIYSMWTTEPVLFFKADSTQKRVLSPEEAAKQEADFMARHSSNSSGAQAVEAFNNIISNPKSSVAKIADSIVDLYKENQISLDQQNIALDALAGKDAISSNRDLFVEQANSVVQEALTDVVPPKDPVVENAKQEYRNAPVEYTEIDLGRSTGEELSAERRLVMLKMANMENARLLKEGLPGFNMEKLYSISDNGEANGVFQFLTDRIVKRNISDEKRSNIRADKPVVPLPSDVQKMKKAEYTGPAITSYAEELLARKAAKEAKPIRKTTEEPPKIEVVKQVSEAPTEDLSSRTQAFIEKVMDSSPVISKETKEKAKRSKLSEEEKRDRINKKAQEVAGRQEAARVFSEFKKIQSMGREIEADQRRSMQREAEGARIQERYQEDRRSQRKADFVSALRQKALDAIRLKRVEERKKVWVELLNAKDAQMAAEFEIKQKMMSDAMILWEEQIRKWAGETKEVPEPQDVDFEEKGISVTSPDLPKKIRFILGFNKKVRAVLPSGNVIYSDDIDSAAKRAEQAMARGR